MKIYLSWESDGECLRPTCHSSVLNDDGISLLECILMDDGGLGYSRSIPWLEEGLDRIRLIRNGEIHFSDWSRETWGAELRVGKVKIYSLYDESYFQILSLEEFENALLAWKDFVQSNSEVGTKCEISI